jgi:hypothetical protein
MKTITFAEICDIISKLDREESENLYQHMLRNPSDEQRTRDSILINSAYCRVLSAIHDAVN